MEAMGHKCVDKTSGEWVTRFGAGGWEGVISIKRVNLTMGWAVRCHGVG